MKVVNIMNFVRQIDERNENSTQNLFEMTAAQLRLVNEYSLDNTFLLQYDVLCDEHFVSLFQSEATDRTELGLWYEIVEPLTTKCGIPYRSEQGWKWDWHIVPGFSMAYTLHQREMLIDEAMRKFKEVFGYFPKTVASWVLDTHTLNYLSKNYDIKAVAICRDQANTDAYTLRGGYFNQAYYPSKNNIFTPAQSKELQISVPVFRLLGPCPIHNYDNNKYSSEIVKTLGGNCFTLEPCWHMGINPESVKWMFDCYYGEESLGFAYAQIGQENSFYTSKEQVLCGTRMQIEQLIERGDVSFQKMQETGEAFKKKYPVNTPATSVVALSNWDSTDVQSVYYNCKNYTANLFRFEDKIFLLSFFMFDERVRELYLEKTCTTFDAVYENLPIVDTMTCSDEDKKQCGLMISTSGASFEVKKCAEGVLAVTFGDECVTFFEDRIEIRADKLILYRNSIRADFENNADGFLFTYNGASYTLCTNGAITIPCGENFEISSNEKTITLSFI